MATSQVIDLAANRAANLTRTGGPKAKPRSNRFVAFVVGIFDVLREARELEQRTLGAGRYRRLGES